MGKSLFSSIKRWLSPHQSPIAIWRHNIWKGKYNDAAEKEVAPYLRDAKILHWIGWSFCLISLFGDVFIVSISTAFPRSGAVLVAFAALIELRVLGSRLAISSIRNGNISPQGFIMSAHLPGQFTPEWIDEKVSGVPVFMWLMGQENQAYKFERRATRMLLLGTVIWAYGDLLI